MVLENKTLINTKSSPTNGSCVLFDGRGTVPRKNDCCLSFPSHSLSLEQKLLNILSQRLMPKCFRQSLDDHKSHSITVLKKHLVITVTCLIFTVTEISQSFYPVFWWYLPIFFFGFHGYIIKVHFDWLVSLSLRYHLKDCVSFRS